MSKEKFLQGRAAIVTGRTSGIGKAISLALAERGADVAIGSRSASTSPCKAEIELLGVKALAIDLDVSSTDSVKAFYDATVQGFGKVDILDIKQSYPQKRINLQKSARSLLSSAATRHWALRWRISL